MLDVVVVANDVNGKAVSSGCGKYIDATTLKSRPRKFRMTAALFKGASLAKFAGPCSQAKSFIESLKEKSFLKSDRYFFRLASIGFK